MSLDDYRIQDPVLTQLSQGYHNAEFVGEYLFPAVEIPKEAGRVPQFGRLAFLVHSTIRELHGASNRLTPEYSLNIPVVLEEHDVEYPIDYREEHDSSYQVKQYALNVIQWVIALGREEAIATLVQNAKNYLPEHVASLTEKEKFSHAESNPLKVFDKGIETVYANIGRKPNVCVISSDVWAVLKENPVLLERIKYTRTGILTPEIFAELINVPTVKIGSAAKGTFSDEEAVIGVPMSKEESDKLKLTGGQSPTGTPRKYHPKKLAALRKVWNNSVILAYTPTRTQDRTNSIYEPAFGYTIRRKGGLFVDTYKDLGGKVEVVRCTDIHKPYLMGVSAGYLIKDCIE